MINIYFMKPMLKLTSLLVVISSLFLFSCVKDLYDPNASNSNPDSDIPADFDFSTTKTVNLTVNVNDEYNNQYFYKVEVYDQNPFVSDTVVNLLGGGVAKGSQPFVSQIVIPQSLNTIYILQTDPLKRESVKAVDVTTVTASSICDFKLSVTPTTKSLESLPTLRADVEYTDKASDYTLPASYETLGATSVTLMGSNYYVPVNASSSNIDFGWLSNSVLYVAGKVTFTSEDQIYMPSNCKLVILSGGEVTIDKAANFEQSGVIVAVHKGGSLTLKETCSAGAGAKIINDGSLTFNKDFTVRSTPLLMNNGTLNGNQVTLTNSAKFVNNLKVVLSTNLIMDSNALFRNNGAFEAVEKLATNNNCVIENNNHLKTIFVHLNSGSKLINNCYVLCEDFYMEQATVVGASGTLVSCQDYYGNNSTITLNGNAIFSIDDNVMKNNTSNNVENGATFVGNVTVTGVPDGSSIPLFIAWKVVNKNKENKVLALAGTMQVAYGNNGQTPVDGFYSSLSNGITFVEVPIINIPGDDCNNGGVTPDPGTETPTDPTFPIKVDETTAYTFAMEDRWPVFGDYDMNDLVYKVDNISKLMNNQNLVTQMSFNVTPLAAGATFKSSAALQFDEIASGGITLTSTNSIGVVESGQAKANIIMFPTVNVLFGKSSPGIINTNPNESKLSASTYTFTINFTNPVSADKVNINKLNFYMIVGDIDIPNRTEIHLAGFVPSSKVKKATNGYKDSNNMVWGIMLPVGNFKYPVEYVKIEDAYPQFKSWATSAGANNKDWYIYPSSDSEKVYTK